MRQLFKENKNKYSRIKSSGIYLIFVTIETTGVTCEEGKEWIDEKGKRLIDKKGDKKAICYTMQRISMTMYNVNAACIISARHSNEELDTVFY